MKASKRCLVEAFDNKKHETEAKSSFVGVENTKIHGEKKNHWTVRVMTTVECCEVNFSSLLLYKTRSLSRTAVEAINFPLYVQNYAGDDRAE